LTGFLLQQAETAGQSAWALPRSSRRWIYFPLSLASWLTIDSKAKVIYAALQQYGLVFSSDDGTTWSRVTGEGLPSTMVLSVFYQPDKDILYVGTSAGLYARSGAGSIFLPIIHKDSE
jgi:hypothetical protein